ncbi:hypothetical protein CcI156_19940 [Frankia sp. CcI156]|uniref:recombinase family protein n=1 Tax=Frankia TaxID=1854 RepID=UPI0003CFA3DB|nr:MULTISPECIES: recombinase family protein [Frankia]ETA00421.1 site-specific recombinase, DNA invertase Pin [Frankia sp. CcI6]KFB03029.1 site-specific recombinase, DNA invertase Pin [Frankia sp. Allo2]OAA20060.1 site-specific recombinase, DNA invertase Pin [Frankia casuarinae]ONH22911.1 hypothetical protein CcI156_19940 [Frankia sp. CcI156]
MLDHIIGAADYARISSDPGNDAKGVARQTEDSQGRIEREPSWRHVGSYIDNDLSATKGKERPEFERLMAAVRRDEVKVIVIYMTGRFVRTRRERMETYELLAKHGVRIVCTNGPDLDFSTPAGRMVAGIMGEVDAHEVEQLATRVSDSHLQAAKEGRPIGGRCYGYRPDPHALKHHKRRLIVPEEAAVIREMAPRALRGETLYSIVQDFNERGVPTLHPGRSRTGGLWSVSVLRDILTNPAIAGRSVLLGVDYGEAEWEPIISYADHLKLVGMFSGRTAPEGWTNRHVHLLSGIALCGKCLAQGREITVTCRPGAKPTPSGYQPWPKSRGYICPDKQRGGCRGLRHAADPVDAYVEETVVRLLGEPGVIDNLVAAEAPDAEEVLKVATEIEACQARAAAVGALMAKDDPTDEVTAIARRAALDQIRDDLTRHRQRQTALARSTVAEGLLDVEDIAHHWEHVMTLSQQRATISALVRITLLPIGRGKRGTTDHVVIDRR